MGLCWRINYFTSFAGNWEERRRIRVRGVPGNGKLSSFLKISPQSHPIWQLWSLSWRAHLQEINHFDRDREVSALFLMINWTSRKSYYTGMRVWHTRWGENDRPCSWLMWGTVVVNFRDRFSRWLFWWRQAIQSKIFLIKLGWAIEFREGN